MSIVTWWGVSFFDYNSSNIFKSLSFKLNYNRYPVWGSLAQDYLSIMASSVSSEHAFSSAGITLSKWHNHLQADIVEALQFLTCFYHHDLIFREVRAFTEEEIFLDQDVDESGSGDTANELSWEELWIDPNEVAESDTEVV
jgi:hypothetical protein